VVLVVSLVLVLASSVMASADGYIGFRPTQGVNQGMVGQINIGRLGILGGNNTWEITPDRRSANTTDVWFDIVDLGGLSVGIGGRHYKDTVEEWQPYSDGGTTKYRWVAVKEVSELRPLVTASLRQLTGKLRIDAHANYDGREFGYGAMVGYQVLSDTFVGAGYEAVPSQRQGFFVGIMMAF
jgi:hypothetical protein